MLEIDRYALRRAAQFQAEVLAHYEVYEFHPVVAKLQVYCSEDLGAFYLDVLKDRLYTTARSRWRAAARRPRCGTSRTPCCAGWRRSSASRPKKPGRCSAARESIFLEEYAEIGAPDEALLAKWNRIREIRDAANKEIEALRAERARSARRCRPTWWSPRRPPTTRCWPAWATT
jgi:isoleucyl-tRNA synthetase